MLLKGKLPALHFLPPETETRTADRPPADVGEPHHCGLKHRSTCESWSLIAIILWWALRHDR